MKFVLVFLLLGSYGPCSRSESSENPQPLVVSTSGPIEGYHQTSYGGRLYEAYEGIPYARPPLGDLRFDSPKSVLPWTDVLMAKNVSSECLQYGFVPIEIAGVVSGSEDCLYLNVYTPIRSNNDEAQNGLHPVVFFIHGGGFLFGAGNLYGPRFLLDRDVTLVTFNYRLGPLGFLSTEDDVVPGNMGLKDQVAALRWVNDNIHYFGGDPSRITLLGQSAAAASVHYHYLTNLTRGLFQRGISMSGTALHPWALIKNPREKAKKLSAFVGCSTDDSQSMVDCLRALPGEQIQGGLSDFRERTYLATGWGPVVEKGGNEETFIDRTPIDIITSGDVQDLPWMTSIVSEEGIFPGVLYIANPESLKDLNDEWETRAPYVLYFNDTIPKSDQPGVAKLIKEHYLGDSDITEATFNQTAKIISDRMFIHGFEDSARSQAKVNSHPVYTYRFSYRGVHSWSESVSGLTDRFGVCHMDDLIYILDSFFDPTSTPDDLDMQKVLTNLLMSFAADGTPDVGVEWPSLGECSTDDFSYLHIAGPEDIGMESDSNVGDKNFWSTIPFDDNIL